MSYLVARDEHPLIADVAGGAFRARSFFLLSKI
jgi:hypothetical protein